MTNQIEDNRELAVRLAELAITTRASNEQVWAAYTFMRLRLTDAPVAGLPVRNSPPNEPKSR
jgi:hypothetical protein